MTWSQTFGDRAFEAARGVAACPHSATCQTDFREKGQRKSVPEHWQLARTPSPDFIGSRYRGLVIVGGNPGIAHSAVHDLNDRRMFELQRQIAQGDRHAFERLMGFLPGSMAHWPQMVDSDGRRRMRYDIEEVAYVDIVKCGTRPGRGDTRSLFNGTPILGRCWDMHTKPLLKLLQPTHIVALWTPIQEVLIRLGFEFQGAIFGHYDGARHLTKDQRYARARHVFDNYYERAET